MDVDGPACPSPTSRVARQATQGVLENLGLTFASA